MQKISKIWILTSGEYSLSSTLHWLDSGLNEEPEYTPTDFGESSLYFERDGRIFFFYFRSKVYIKFQLCIFIQFLKMFSSELKTFFLFKFLLHLLQYFILQLSTSLFQK